MGSADVQHFVRADELHVALSVRDDLWWVVGRLGSYGSSRSRTRAVALAGDVCTTAGTRPVIVHARDGAVHCIIRRFHRLTPTPQFFQDGIS